MPTPVPKPALPAGESPDRLTRALPAPLSTEAISSRRAAAAAISLVWCGGLAWLALATSNPVTLNRRQIMDADAVVTVQITDRTAGTCRVVRQWRGTAVPERIVVQSLTATSVRVDGEWILPLKVTRRGYEVQPSLLPAQTRLVYPATQEAVRQLEGLVAGGG